MPDVSLLQHFVLAEVLSEEPERCRLTLLGTLPSNWGAVENSEDPCLQAIIRIEKNPLASEHAASFFNELVQKAKIMGSTDI